MRTAVFVFFIYCVVSYGQSRQGKLIGQIVDEQTGKPLINVNITAQPGRFGTVSDSLGYFKLILPLGTYHIKMSYVGYEPWDSSVILSKDSNSKNLFIKLRQTAIGQEEVQITGKKEIFSHVTQKLDRLDIISMPTIYSDVLKSVKILAGVTSNNELTSGYNVRGGNYNENLIYIDGFEIYRPFLVTKGIEENQSIVNGDLIEDLNFNGGTFSARLGDKMSSALELTYNDNFDTTLHGVARTGILNSGITLYKRFGKLNIAGALRYTYPKLFETSLQTKGNYDPAYFDIQLIANYKFSQNSNFELLFINAVNKFYLTPSNWQGNFSPAPFDVRQVDLKFSGSNNYNFNTRLSGLKYNIRLSRNTWLSILGSIYSTEEKNYKNLTSDIYYSNNAYYANQNKAYLKTNYDYANDNLNMDTYELKPILKFKIQKHSIEAGAAFRFYKFTNTVNESGYETGIDSVLISPYNINLVQNVKFPSYSGYIDDIINFNKKIQAEAGIRILRYDFSKETLVSPRVSINYYYSATSSFNFSTGFYYQPPFYYEVSYKNIKNSTTTLKSQRSINFMINWETKTLNGTKYSFDIYYKKLDNLIPYYIDQLKLVYGYQNSYEGYAKGFDFQFEGDLVQGIKSWIGYSYLDTGERLKGSVSGYTRRLPDQRHTIKIFLQDRVKKHPNFQAHVRFLIGSGLLFHPRYSAKDPVTNKYYIRIDSSQTGVIPFYFRTDMGLSYKFIFNKKMNLVLVVEVYNVFNKKNIVSYNWYHVFPQTTQLVGVPMILSGRFFSLDVRYNF